MGSPALQVDGLCKRYTLGAGAAYRTLRESLSGLVRAPFGGRRERATAPELWALRDVSFEVAHGQVLGIIGRNGAGKSTLLKILARITEPTAGRALVRGRVGALLEVGTGFHPELTGRENIYLNGAILGMSRADISRRFDEIVAFAGLEAFLDTPVKRYSSGMYMRLAFSVAAHLEPEILVIDEVLAVGDVEFQRKCLGKMGEVATSGRTVLFVSHNMSAMRALATTAVLLSRGQIAAVGEVDRVVGRYLEGLVEAPADDDLLSRADRTGTGEIRFARLAYADARGAPVRILQGGQTTDFVMEVESRLDHSLENVSFFLVVHDSLGTPVINHSNLYSGEPLRLGPGRSTLTCRLPRLPLSAGMYRVDLGAKIGDASVDILAGAGFFQVIDGDYYGTGHQPPPHFPVLVDASWRAGPDPLQRGAS